MLIIGHRGSSSGVSENTLEAFAHAVSYKVDEIETDLRVTKDNIVVLHHDMFVLNSRGVRRLIRQTKYAKLKRIKADMPRLDELFKEVSPSTTLYLEVKPREPIEPIVKEINLALQGKWTAEKIKLASFDQSVLRKLKKELPRHKLIVLESVSITRAKLRAKRLKTNYISINKSSLSAKKISRLTKKGYKVYTYTLNNRYKARFWDKAGLYGVITDYPDKFAKL
jgi:glycerophosphoryl diester phosphodiesterase